MDLASLQQSSKLRESLMVTEAQALLARLATKLGADAECKPTFA